MPKLTLKTEEEFLFYLSDDETRKAYLENIANDSTSSLIKYSTNITPASILTQAFNWESSPQKYEYWRNEYIRLRKLEKLFGLR